MNNFFSISGDQTYLRTIIQKQKQIMNRIAIEHRTIRRKSNNLRVRPLVNSSHASLPSFFIYTDSFFFASPSLLLVYIILTNLLLFFFGFIFIVVIVILSAFCILEKHTHTIQNRRAPFSLSLSISLSSLSFSFAVLFRNVYFE